ncbi:phosphocholine-specific phospholipase C [Sphingobacterium sp. HJSM2_6]|uniref:phosphocholine-specific phospholipase C n=1 Tax=Sphingobacterium sp. HJSM2_6 TaxID=3366264 RepID=UPI003BB9C674
MNTRRDFLKQASLLAGASAAFQLIPASIQRALAIEAAAGTSYLDAEHIVFLMQENRSFDHCYGTLKGVRGFNDPRAMIKPDLLPVWYQQNKLGEYREPFHLDIENTQVTWMGDLPHGWRDMVQARNEGKMDAWLEAKRAGNPKFQHIPLTMGYYTRKDIPFYYAFADAFTVCDQHFCSSLTGTSANRSYFWSGTIREEPHQGDSIAHTDNGQINYKDVTWKTYPERLQEAGVSWKVYQNELSLPVGLDGEEEDWLANFTDNNLEFHKQYQVKFHPAYQQFAQKRVKEIDHQLMVSRFASEEAYQKVLNQLNAFKKDIEDFSATKFAALSLQEQQIHQRAFTTNATDPDYHQLAEIAVGKQGAEELVKVPKGDVFHQFRQDVKNNELPTVSWLVAPCRFSDHPSSPWFGAWYVSETLDILTANPEVWKKTIFVLTYDENDGYFDHVSPFVPPLSSRKESGKVPKSVDTQDDYVTNEQEKKRSGNPAATIDSPIGLGYRVPLVIASPWSKGGWVNSEVFDHTSTLQFLEHFIQKKYKKDVNESNISEWRRLVCGDLTSVFRPIPDLKKPELEFVKRDAYVDRIFSSRQKELPGNFKSYATIEELKKKLGQTNISTGLNLQEKGTKLACALPYDLDVNIEVDNSKQLIRLVCDLKGNLASQKRVGIPLYANAWTKNLEGKHEWKTWNFGVRAKEELYYEWPFSLFNHADFDIRVYGPNGFYRRFKGSLAQEVLDVSVQVNNPKKGLIIKTAKYSKSIQITDPSYKRKGEIISSGKKGSVNYTLVSSNGWYEFMISCEENGIQYSYAGHQENGKSSVTDPLMGDALAT